MVANGQTVNPPSSRVEKRPRYVDPDKDSMRNLGVIYKQLARAPRPDQNAIPGNKGGIPALQIPPSPRDNTDASLTRMVRGCWIGTFRSQHVKCSLREKSPNAHRCTIPSIVGGGDGMSVDAHHKEKDAVGVQYTSSASLALKANSLKHAIWQAHDESRTVTFIPRPRPRLLYSPMTPVQSEVVDKREPSGAFGRHGLPRWRHEDSHGHDSNFEATTTTAHLTWSSLYSSGQSSRS